jgi:hypothetical protein
MSGAGSARRRFSFSEKQTNAVLVLRAKGKLIYRDGLYQKKEMLLKDIKDIKIKSMKFRYN